MARDMYAEVRVIHDVCNLLLIRSEISCLDLIVRLRCFAGTQLDSVHFSSTLNLEIIRDETS